MAESIVNNAVESIGKMIIEEAKFLDGVEHQVEQLNLELGKLQHFLRNAEARQHEHEDLKAWITQSKGLAYEAEDLIECYAFKISSQSGCIFDRCICIFKEWYVRYSMESEIQKLELKISGLTNNFQNYGIVPIKKRKIPASSEAQESLETLKVSGHTKGHEIVPIEEGENRASSSDQQPGKTYPGIVEDDLIPSDNDVENLVRQLMDEYYLVFSILGENNLPQRVYNHPKVESHFENLARISVPKQWEIGEILQGILIEFLPGQSDEIKKWTEKDLVLKLREILQNKKCLVVLDNVWSSNVWEYLKFLWTKKGKGSKLLLTSPVERVASQRGPLNQKDGLLSDSESWGLLQVKALRGRIYAGPEESREMEKVGEEMVKQCEGLPLSVDVLAGILVNKRDVREWDEVHNTIKTCTGRSSKVEEILGLSYNELRPELKPCFLYLSRFPEHSKIKVEQLCLLWLAEGSISVKDRKGEEPMIDVAENYLEELAEPSMVRVKVDKDMVRKTKFKYCRLEGPMRELSLKKAKEENFFSCVHSRNGLDTEAYRNSSSSQEIRRLSIHFDDVDVPLYVPPPKRMTKHLRSLRFFVRGLVQETMKSQFKGFGMLSVLELERQGGRTFLENFEVIGSLIHLRYFSFRSNSFNYWSERLPPSMANLKHLQTINLQHSVSIIIPNIFWKMSELRHIYLPYNVGVDLRFDGLNKLEILHGFENRRSSYKDLVNLPSLRYVSIRHFVQYMDDVDDVLTFISNSNSLHKASLYVDLRGIGKKTVGSGILRKFLACFKISQLEITGGIYNFPKYEAGLASNLVSLTLKEMELRDKPMETLERFPNLRRLELVECSGLTRMQCRAFGFPRLRKLVMSRLESPKEWSIAKGSMPSLSSLNIILCKHLEMIPDGLRYIKSLKKLNIRHARPKLLKRLQEEDFRHIQHVPLVTILW